MTSRKVDGNSSVVDNLLSAASALDPTGASGFILGSRKSILSIRDRAYISKFGKFWRAFEEKKIEVDEFISKTEEREDWQKVGENFLLVMDSFSDFDKCYYYGKVWIAWLKKEINTNEFIEVTNILQNIFITDLNYIFYHSKDVNFKYLNEDRLYNCGFLKRGRLEELDFIRDILNIDRSEYKSYEAQIFENIDNIIFHVKEILLNPYLETEAGKKLIQILTKK
jgi:hypothetical protein